MQTSNRKCDTCHYEVLCGCTFDERSHKPYHDRYLIAIERFGHVSTCNDIKEYTVKIRSLRNIILSSTNEDEYLNAAIEYIRTLFEHSVTCCVSFGNKKEILKHPTFEQYIPMVMVDNWPQHVYISLWKHYGSIPDIIPPNAGNGYITLEDGTKEITENFVWHSSAQNEDKATRCPVCYLRYVMPYNKNEHAQYHEKWLRDNSLTQKEYNNIISCDDDKFRHIKIEGHYYCGSGLFRKRIDNLRYEYEDDLFRRGDLLDDFQLAYLHRETTGLDIKTKVRIANMFKLGHLDDIAKDDELWEIICTKFPSLRDTPLN